MLQSYCELRSFLSHVKEEELKDLQLDPVDDIEVVVLLAGLADLQFVTLVLQSNTSILADPRTLFDGMQERYEGHKSYLDSREDIVENLLFKQATVNIQRVYGKSLNTARQRAVCHLCTDDTMSRIRHIRIHIRLRRYI